MRSAVHLPALIGAETAGLLSNLRRSWRVLWTLTMIECRRKYAGSILGTLWYPLYSLLLLGSYCFLYLVVFRVRYRELGTYQFVLFVFCGLDPVSRIQRSGVDRTGIGEGQSRAAAQRGVSDRARARQARAGGDGRTVQLADAADADDPADVVRRLAPALSAGAAGLAAAVHARRRSGFCRRLRSSCPTSRSWSTSRCCCSCSSRRSGSPSIRCRCGCAALVYLNPLTYLIEGFRFALIGIRVSPMWSDALFLLAALALAARRRDVLPPDVSDLQRL